MGKQTLDEFVAEMKGLLNEFVTYWQEHHGDDSEEWPTERTESCL